MVQIAALYFWSGISKFGGYFWGWVFQFQFLAMAPISYHLRSLYLDSNGAPRRCAYPQPSQPPYLLPTIPPCRTLHAVMLGSWELALKAVSPPPPPLPSSHIHTTYLVDAIWHCCSWSTWFGFAGVLGEAAAGAAMLAPVATIRELAVYYAMAMHAFIVIFGIGPYRWNFVQAYFALCAARLCDSGVVHDDAVLPSPLSRMCDGPCLGLAVVLATSVAVPIIGAIDPKFLGRWLGGFRSAMFHFAGNERHTFYLIRKAAVEAAEHRAASCDADTNEVSSTRKLLRSRMDEAAEKGGAKFTNDPEFINFPMWVDGFDIRGPVKEAAEQLVPKSQVSNFEESHFVVPIPFMRTFGICLYTKDDESIPSVHRWYSNLVLNVLRADGGQVDPGDVLLFGVDPLALAELACARLRYKSWDATDLGSGCKARGKGLIVWR